VAGSLAGILAVAFGIPGLACFAVVALLSSRVPPRFAFVAGLLTASGLLWGFFAAQEVLRRATSDSPSSEAPLLPFAALSLAVLAIGVFLLFVTRRRSTDMHRR